jgi:AraC-like DNA-binding protein
VDDPYAEPEAAIACYERWSALSVAVHDLGRALAPHLGPDRQWHTGALCALMKNGAHGARCLTWDDHGLHPRVGAHPRGLVRRCHAGLVELVAPVLRRDRLELVLFAGQRSAGDDLALDEQDPERTPWPSRTRLPAALGAEEATHALEGLRQLGARLARWIDEHGEAARGRADRPAHAARGLAIRAFIQHEHRHAIGLIDLASHLGLSLHRAAHVVRAECGSTFVALLTEARLRSACALLRHSRLTIAEVARECGFGDSDHFHRVFRRRRGTTPARFREANGGP